MVDKENNTKENLEMIWEQLDEASGSLYNAQDNLTRMNRDGELDGLIESLSTIDISLIDKNKNTVEELIEQKEVEQKKLVDLDNKILNIGELEQGGFSVYVTVESFAGGTDEITLYLLPLYQVIHLANYEKEDQLYTIIESLKHEINNSEDSHIEDVYKEIIKHLEKMKKVM